MYMCTHMYVRAFFKFKFSPDIHRNSKCGMSARMVGIYCPVSIPSVLLLAPCDGCTPLKDEPLQCGSPVYSTEPVCRGGDQTSGGGGDGHIPKESLSQVEYIYVCVEMEFILWLCVCYVCACMCVLCVCMLCGRVELYLQQNEIMNLFVDDYKNLPDTSWITGNKSDSSLNVSAPVPPSLPLPPPVTQEAHDPPHPIGVPVIHRLAVQ